MNNLSIRKMNELSKKKKKGFTLIELIIVIAIIAILAAIAMPKFGQIRENGNIKADIATAKNIQTAVSTAVANGTISLDAGSLQDTQLESVLDSGTVPTVKSSTSAQLGAKFTASVGSDGTVTVDAGTLEIFPTPASGSVYATGLAS